MSVYSNHGLSAAEVSRYGRQILVSEIGVKGQCSLQSSSALIIGAGGLGCPVAQYLAAAGVGRLGIVDDDVVEVNNLHRQVLHTEQGVGTMKADSIVNAVKRLNSSVQCTAHNVRFEASNALGLVTDYDILIDCTDNAPTRYILNDAAVLLRKVLVSGSALKWDGQMTVYNYRKSQGPCYRCVFPNPPPANTVVNCSDGGVIGPIVGMVGSLQALEAVKLLSGLEPSYAGRMFVFDGLEGTTRSIKLRNRRVDCAVCGDRPTITQLIDYNIMCSLKATDKPESHTKLSPNERINALDFAIEMQSLPFNESVIVDTRPANEFSIGSLPGSINIPLDRLIDASIDDIQADLGIQSNAQSKRVIVVCRRGNDSQEAVLLLKNKHHLDHVFDVVGGLTAYAAQVDQQFPIY